MSENFDLDTGKNIVDALKAGEEEENLLENEDTQELSDNSVEEEASNDTALSEESEESYNLLENDAFADFDENANKFDGELNQSNGYESNIFKENAQQHAVVENYANDIYNFEVPNNVAVLKKLIAKLPSGVTRQTGAMIIKQTMEALGISMRSVLQEAQQLQDQLSTTTKECQATISEYKRQIVTLEEQVQSYKKQYNNLNELVSLFIQTES